jgi:hypothetical protein
LTAALELALSATATATATAAATARAALAAPTAPAPTISRLPRASTLLGLGPVLAPALARPTIGHLTTGGAFGRRLVVRGLAG